MALQIDGQTAIFWRWLDAPVGAGGAGHSPGRTAHLVIGAGPGACMSPGREAHLHSLDSYPSLAQIAGHALSNIFLDALAVDVERIRRINQTLKLVPPSCAMPAI